MKAVLDQDIIVHITEKGDTEIGTIPAEKKGVGLERLRWDGTNIVDLTDLSEIWVEPFDHGYFRLHAIEVPGSQRVVMNYQHRRNLVLDGGVIRLKTPQEILGEIRAIEVAEIKNRLAGKLNRDVGNLEQRLLDAYKFIFALIVYSRQQPQLLADFFDQIIPDIKDTFPLDRVRDELMSSAKSMKVFVGEYYQDIDRIE